VCVCVELYTVLFMYLRICGSCPIEGCTQSECAIVTKNFARRCTCVCGCVRVCVYVCAYVCVYVYIYTYIPIYIKKIRMGM
jgi:hypothetical protein